MSSVSDIREMFPALKLSVYGKPLVYFDNAATAQKPVSVLELQDRLYRDSNANVHRAVHFLSAKATEAYESGRQAVADYLGASREEIILTSGTTASMNLLAGSFAERYLHRGDRILISEAEHHANIVPWQRVCERYGATLDIIPVDDSGILDIRALEQKLGPDVKLLSIAHISNVLGIVNPIREIIGTAHRHNVPVAVDGAQGIVHTPVNVAELDCDFYAFSGHKLYAPTGIGVLFGKKKWLEEMPPFLTGGEMVETVTFGKTTYAPLPLKFEAGTPNFVAAACLKPAVEFTASVMKDSGLAASERENLRYLMEALPRTEGLHIHGTPEKLSEKAPVISFTVDGVHPSDLAQILDKMGFAVRSGLMCAEPVVTRFSRNGMLRASLAPYNTLEECEAFTKGLEKAVNMLR